ncbi:MAG: nitrogen fixation protein NifX [Leptolyngbyaceae bacterium]|nr:nitrogen fixation protein NifX [Leptolyngbyaceae bacterium]
MKIAFTTKDSVHINEHFGWAKLIDVYTIDQDGYRFDRQLKFEPDMDSDDHNDRLIPKLEAIADCKIVYVSAIGAGAAARIINSGITPIKADSEEQKIEDILVQLLKTLNGNPPPWLRKALKQDAPTYDVFEEEEEEVVL